MAPDVNHVPGQMVKRATTDVERWMRSVVNGIVIALICAGCSTTEPAPGGLPGTYTLVTMDGRTLQQVRDANGGWG